MTFLAKNHNDAFEFVKVMYKILLVSFSGHGVYLDLCLSDIRFRSSNK